jgi:hypothetical protein
MSPKKKAIAVVAVACVTGGEEEAWLQHVVLLAPLATCPKKKRALLSDVDEQPGLL